MTDANTYYINKHLDEQAAKDMAYEVDLSNAHVYLEESIDIQLEDDRFDRLFELVGEEPPEKNILGSFVMFVLDDISETAREAFMQENQKYVFNGNADASRSLTRDLITTYLLEDREDTVMDNLKRIGMI